MPTGIPEWDRLKDGIPRGAITEVSGGPASGRSTLLGSLLAGATQRQEACAVIDTADTFDPASAVAAGVDLRFLLWVRCTARKRCALQVADWLLQGGGFGLVALDLGDLTAHDIHNIPLHTWFRFRRAIDHKPTALLVIAPVASGVGASQHCTGSSASLQLEMRQKTALWQGQLFRGAAIEAKSRKPVHSAGARFEAESCLLA